MSKVHEEVLAANAAYAANFGDRGEVLGELLEKSLKTASYDDIPVYGYVYAVETGRLVEVPEATAAGRAH